MTRIKEEDSFATQKKTDKARIGSASLCVGLKAICFTPILLFAMRIRDEGTSKTAGGGASVHD